MQAWKLGPALAGGNTIVMKVCHSNSLAVPLQAVCLKDERILTPSSRHCYACCFIDAMPDMWAIGMVLLSLFDMVLSRDE
jgi:hypothetical protein